MPPFSIKDCVLFGWETFKKRPWLLILASLIVIAANVGAGFVGAFVVAVVGEGMGAFINFIASFIVGVLVGIGFIALYLKAHDAPESAELKDLWHPELFAKYLLTSLLVGLIITLGFILLVIPGIILSLVFMFTQYLVVDRGLGPIAALKESARITRGSRFTLFLLVLVIILINVVGAIALGVGVLVSMPVSMLAVVHAYRTLLGRAGPAPSVA